MKTLGDPTKRNQMLQLIQDAQQGKQTPQDTIVEMAKLMQQSVADERLKEPLNPLWILPLTLMGVGGAGYVSQRMNNLSSAKDSIVGKGIRIFDRLPIISQIGDILAYLDPSYKPKSQLGHWQTAMQGEQRHIDTIRRQFASKYLGNNGYYSRELDALEKGLSMTLPRSTVKNIVGHIRTQTKHRELMQVFSPELEHYVPRSLAEFLGNSLKSTELHQTTLTLKQLDQMIVKNGFLEAIGQAAYRHEIPFKTAEDIVRLLKSTDSKTFSDVLKNQLLSSSNFRPYINKLFKLDGKQPYFEAVRKELGLLPLHDYFNHATRNELYQGLKKINLNAKPHETLLQLQHRLSRFHISNQLKGLSAWNTFETGMRGFLRRLSVFENQYIPLAFAEHNLRQRMASMNIGPVGQLLGKALFYLDRSIGGTSFQRWGISMLKETSWTRYGRLFLPSLLIFGLGVPLVSNAPKEVRLAKFTDGIAAAFGGWYGFTLTQNLMSQFMVLERSKFLGRLAAKKLPIIPFGLTYGSVIQGFLAPVIIGGLFAKFIQKPVNFFFGDPTKMEQKLIEKTIKGNLGNFSPSVLLAQQTMAQPNYIQQQPVQQNFYGPRQYSQYTQQPLSQPYGYPQQPSVAIANPVTNPPLPPTLATQAIGKTQATKKEKDLVTYDTSGLSASLLKPDKIKTGDQQKAQERKMLRQLEAKLNYY